MKSPIKFLLIMLVLLIPSMTKGHGFELSGEVDVKYLVTSSSEVDTGYYLSDGTSGKFHVDNGTTIDLKIEEITDPQTRMDLTLGNLSLTGASDFDVEQFVVLGYYLLGPSLGFVANTSWVISRSAFFDLENENPSFDTELSSFNLNGMGYYLGGINLETIEIVLIDPGQTTTLVYDKNNGLLLQASTIVTFGETYELSFTIASINGNAQFFHEDHSTTSSDDSANFSSGIFILSSIFITILVIQRKNRLN